MPSSPPEFSLSDRLAIHELIALHGHLCDGGELDRLDEFMTADAVYDLTAYGAGALVGPGAVADAARLLGDKNPLAHHVTHIVVGEIDDDGVQVRSKGLAVNADGTAGSVVYEDVVRRTPDGWRMARRKVLPRRTPLQP